MLFLFHVVAVIAVVFGSQLKVVGIEFAYMQINLNLDLRILFKTFRVGF